MAKREFWDEWVDLIGQTYKPGDFIAVPTGIYNGGANMCVAQVVTINKTKSNGQPYVRKTTEIVGGKRTLTEKPWCSVTYKPMMDSRKTRWSTRKDKQVSNATCLFPENIVKLDVPPLLRRMFEGPTEEEQQQELADIVANLSRMTEELSNEHDGTAAE